MKINKSNIKKHLPQIRQQISDELEKEPKEIAKSALEQIIQKKASAQVAQQSSNAGEKVADDTETDTAQQDLKRIEQIEEEMRVIRQRREDEWEKKFREKEEEKKRLEEEQKKEQEVVMPVSKKARGMLGGSKGPVEKNKKGELKSG